MPERESMSPEVIAALRAYEIEMRDGTERSQKEAFRTLRAAQQRLGGTAVAATTDSAPKTTIEPSEQQLAVS